MEIFVKMGFCFHSSDIRAFLHETAIDALDFLEKSNALENL